MNRLFLLLPLFLAAVTGCQTASSMAVKNNSAARAAVTAGIAAEPKGTYYVGRRYYKVDYKFWGWVRRSGESWSKARLVMMNENTRPTPDRAAGQLGVDNNHEYKLTGDFSGESVYEPASNGIYPEFILRGAELLSSSPGPIYKQPGATDPTRRVIAQPY